jgi:CotH kinase protein
MGAQDLLDSFYSIDNLVSIEIAIDSAKWNDLVLKASPREVGAPNSDPPQTHYDWVETTSVTISGTKFPKKSTFTQVAIIKKSFYGSLSFTKPSFKLDFTKLNKANEDEIKSLIGTDRLVLNNCKQDPAYVRQPLGYELLRQADLPSFRCNFATVRVNGPFWGGKDEIPRHGTVKTTFLPADGVYVNMEPFKKKFVENRFKSDQGNAYEITYLDDFDPDRLAEGYLTFEGFSEHKDRKDLLRAAREIKDQGLSGAKKVIAWDQYIRFFAMEALLQHWDGYNKSMNNTLLYNDQKAKADPDIKKNEINFSFIPSGVDQILGNDQEILFSGWKSVLANLTIADKEANAKLNDQIRKLAEKIFAAKNLADSIYPYLVKETDVLRSAKASFKQDDVDAIKKRLSNIQSWAYAKVGAPK